MKPESSKDNSVRIAEEEDLEAPKKIEDVVVFLPIDRKRENSATNSKPSDRCKSGFLPIGKRGLTNSPPRHPMENSKATKPCGKLVVVLFSSFFVFLPFGGRRGCPFSATHLIHSTTFETRERKRERMGMNQCSVLFCGVLLGACCEEGLWK